MEGKGVGIMKNSLEKKMQESALYRLRFNMHLA